MTYHELLTFAVESKYKELGLLSALEREYAEFGEQPCINRWLAVYLCGDCTGIEGSEELLEGALRISEGSGHSTYVYDWWVYGIDD